MSKDNKPVKNALRALGPIKDPQVEPTPPVVVEKDPLEVSMAKLVLAAGPGAHTSLIRGTQRIKKIMAGNYGLVVTQEIEQNKDDVWFTPWSNVVWLRHG